MSKLLKKILFRPTLSIKRWTSTVSKLSYLHHIGTHPLLPLTVGDLLEQAVQKYGDREALIARHQNKVLTFRDVFTQTDALAAGLVKVGLQKGDRLGLLAPNLVEWHITKMACARLGLVLVALNPAYEAPEIEYCINKVNIRAIVCGHKFKSLDFYEVLKELLPDLEKYQPGKIKSSRVPSLETIITVTEEYKPGTFNFQEILSFADENSIKSVRSNTSAVQPDDGCNIQFTSGTTGKPKAALLSHFNLVNNGYLIGKRNELNEKHHKICTQNPFFHAFGITITIMASLNFGATLVLPGPTYNPNQSLDAIKNEKCTIVHGTPTMFIDLVKVQEQRKEDISPEIAVCGGAPNTPHLFQQILDVLKIKKVKSVYGLTETTAVVFQSRPNDDKYKSLNTLGHLGEHLEAKVIDENGKIVLLNTPGELCIRGYCNMLGYWGDEEKTKEIFGNDQWLKTGDQFVLQDDGYGKIVGRLKEMIIRGGENIFPKEIEDFLNTHPDIREVHVIGLPHERYGEEVCACVRIKEGANLTLEKINEFAKGKIASFKIPSKLQIVEEFPKTASGKVQKFKLVQQFKK